MIKQRKQYNGMVVEDMNNFVIIPLIFYWLVD